MVINFDEIEGLSEETREHLLGVGVNDWSGGTSSRALPNGWRLVILNPKHGRSRNNATLMEEVCHVFLGHKANRLSIVAQNKQGKTVARDYNEADEEAAYAVGAPGRRAPRSGGPVTPPTPNPAPRQNTPPWRGGSPPVSPAQRPNRLSIVAQNKQGKTVARDYNEADEEAAYAVGAAALVPYAGLRALMKRGMTSIEIARHFNVSRELVEYRLKVSRLRSEEHTSELQSRQYLVCRLLLEK